MMRTQTPTWKMLALSDRTDVLIDNFFPRTKIYFTSVDYLKSKLHNTFSPHSLPLVSNCYFSLSFAFLYYFGSDICDFHLARVFSYA